MQYYLSSVNFHPTEKVEQNKNQEACVFVIEQQKPSENRGSQVAEAFFHATYLTKKLLDNEEQTEDENKLFKFCSENATAVELQFRSIDIPGHIISITVRFQSLKAEVSSYYWQKKKRSYQKIEQAEKVNAALVLELLQRIYIKRDNKILHLTQGYRPVLKQH